MRDQRLQMGSSFWVSAKIYFNQRRLFPIIDFHFHEYFNDVLIFNLPDTPTAAEQKYFLICGRLLLI